MEVPSDIPLEFMEEALNSREKLFVLKNRCWAEETTPEASTLLYQPSLMMCACVVTPSVFYSSQIHLKLNNAAIIGIFLKLRSLGMPRHTLLLTQSASAMPLHLSCSTFQSAASLCEYFIRRRLSEGGLNIPCHATSDPQVLELKRCTEVSLLWKMLVFAGFRAWIDAAFIFI